MNSPNVLLPKQLSRSNSVRDLSALVSTSSVASVGGAINPKVAQRKKLSFTPSKTLSKFNFASQKDEKHPEFDILKLMTPSNTLAFLSKTPIFFKFLVNYGKLDPNVVSCCALTFTEDETSKYVSNLVYESSIYSSLQKIRNFGELENSLSQVDFIDKVTVWESIPSCDSFFSKTRNEIKAKSAPRTETTFGVLKDSILIELEISEMSPYRRELIKLMMALIEKRIPPPQTGLAPKILFIIFQEFRKGLVSHTTASIEDYMLTLFKCESIVIYEFQGNHLIRLRDGQAIPEEDCPLVYKATLLKRPINYPKDQLTDSILIYPILKKGKRYIFSLFGKSDQICFSSEDFYLLQDIAEAASCSLFLTDFLQSRIQVQQQQIQNLKELEIVSNAISNTENGWSLIKETASQLFKAEAVFVCIYDGLAMKYLPTEKKFEQCISYYSYSSRDVILLKKGEPKFREEVYTELEINAEKVIAFPFRITGRIAGAIELINPIVDSVSQEMQLLFSSIVSFSIQF